LIRVHIYSILRFIIGHKSVIVKEKSEYILGHTKIGQKIASTYLKNHVLAGVSEKFRIKMLVKMSDNL